MPDLATADTNGTAFCALSAGSHAFVRCYGERCLRCTWLSFPFGFAGGHPLLANNHMVLMAGEIEVDSAGNLTRWLNKSGLYMPPRWAVGQAGLPFDTAWLFVTDNEVSWAFLCPSSSLSPFSPSLSCVQFGFSLFMSSVVSCAFIS